MIHNQLRIGNFTSSEIARLMGNAKKEGELSVPALTYIEEKVMERRLGRSVDIENKSHELAWGKLVEGRVFDLLGLEYKLVSQDTLEHPTIKGWSGSPDANKFGDVKTVVEIKCPMTMKSFCQLVDGLYSPLYRGDGLAVMNQIRDKHPSGEKYYWQIVSNADLTDSEEGELIVYVPYKEELEEIREEARGIDSIDQYKYYWLDSAMDDELPYLVKGGYYKNINIIKFKIPREDKKRLEEKVKEAVFVLEHWQ